MRTNQSKRKEKNKVRGILQFSAHIYYQLAQKAIKDAPNYIKQEHRQ